MVDDEAGCDGRKPFQVENAQLTRELVAVIMPIGRRGLRAIVEFQLKLVSKGETASWSTQRIAFVTARGLISTYGSDDVPEVAKRILSMYCPGQ